MSFKLNRCGGGCYSLLFHGNHVGAVFAQEGGPDEGWVAVINEQWAAQNRDLPHPFTTTEHCFPTLQRLLDWLGLPSDARAGLEPGNAAPAAVGWRVRCGRSCCVTAGQHRPGCLTGEPRSPMHAGNDLRES
jgi:hypothetical protein